MKQSKTVLITSFLVAALMVASPFASFAKDNGNNNNGGNNDNGNRSSKTKEIKIGATASYSKTNDNKEVKLKAVTSTKSDNKDNENDGENNNGNNNDQNDNGNHATSTTSVDDLNCFKIFGHYINISWFNHIVSTQAKKECGKNGTTTPPVVDVTAPVINSFSVNAGKTQAEVRWNTNEKADSAVFISIVSPVNTSTSSATNSRNGFTTNHRLIVRKLTPNTTYYVIVRSKNRAGNTSFSSQLSFTTKPTTGDTQAAVISNVASVAGTTSVQVSWNTNENTTGRVYYSIVSPVVIASSSFATDSSLGTNHVLTIPGLATSTTYYFVVEATDAAGNISLAPQFSAVTTTPAVDTTAPVISAQTVSLGTTTVTANWTTNEPATSRVFYSLLTPVNVTSSSTPVVENLTLTTSHSLSISGLATSTLYHLIIQSADSSGNVANTSEFTASTL